MTKSRDRLPDGLSPLKHSFQVRPSVAIAGTISPTAYAQTPDAQTSDSVTLSSTAQSLLSNSCGFRKPQIRAYRWCSPPRIGCAIMSPNRSIGRVQGASLPSER
jgi:hypothetical protein